MKRSSNLLKGILAVAVLSAVLAGCATTSRGVAGAGDKEAFLFAAVAEQTATGARDCQRYADGLAARLARSPHRYDLKPLYYCSVGVECHVVLEVDTGEAQYAADNGALIPGHIEPLPAFEEQIGQHSTWRQLDNRDARLILMAQRYGRRS